MKRDDAINLVKQGFEQLESAIKAGKSDDLNRYLSTMSRFHKYSFRNTMLIFLQKPDATRVAGFNAWKKMGRTVKKGEKGIAIFAPMPFKKKPDAQAGRTDDSNTESDETTMMGFKVVHVFDVSQTEGEPLPEIGEVKGSVGDQLARIKQLVVQTGIELVFESIEDGASGYSQGGKIVIEGSLSEAEMFAVIAHELAHERLHHGERREKTSKTIRETEAEAVSYILCNAIGLDCSTHCSDYIQLYNGSSETLRESLGFIQSTAQWMIERIRSIELACEHTMSLNDDSGRTIGTWVKDSSVSPAKFVCSVCGKFYGYAKSKQAVSMETV